MCKDEKGNNYCTEKMVILINDSYQEYEKNTSSLMFQLETTTKQRYAGRKIIPSQMEVTLLHCSVDITQKRRLFKNTKETEKMLEG